MEQHLILKLDGQLKEKIESDLQNKKTNFYIEKINDRDYILNYNDEIVKLKLVDLPCIVESHKTVNKQQFKVCDISQMLVINNDDTNNNENYEKYTELSGLTPPLKYVKVRRFRKRRSKYNMIEIEKKVAELIEKDMKANGVEIIFSDDYSGKIIDKRGIEKHGIDKHGIDKRGIEKHGIEKHGIEKNKIYSNEDMIHNEFNEVTNDELIVELQDKDAEANSKIPDNDVSEDSLSDLAAELEMNLVTEKESRELIEKRRELAEIRNKIKIKEEQMAAVVNPIIKKRICESLNQLKKEHDDLQKVIQELEK